MAAPVGHIVCAMALMSNVKVASPKNFYIGTSFPDIRYVSSVARKATHHVSNLQLKNILQSENDFESGRKFHVFVDKKREKFMQRKDAYAYIPSGPWQSQMLKIVEDHVLFSKIKNNFESETVFAEVIDEELIHKLTQKKVRQWHDLLKVYLSSDYSFHFFRYFHSAIKFKDALGEPKFTPKGIWQNIKSFCFFVYAYIQVERLSRDPDLKAIILDFYEKKIHSIIEEELNDPPKKKLGAQEISLPKSMGNII